MCDLTLQSWAPPIHLPFGQTITPAVHDPFAKLHQFVNGTDPSASSPQDSGQNNGLPSSGDPNRGTQIDLSA